MRRAVVAALPLFLIAAGCSASTPENTVKNFVSARMEGNEKGAAKLTLEKDLSGFMGGETFFSGTSVSFDVSRAEVDETRAVVMAHFRRDGEVVDIPYVCSRVGNQWKVALRETENLWMENPSP